MIILNDFISTIKSNMRLVLELDVSARAKNSLMIYERIMYSSIVMEISFNSHSNLNFESMVIKT